MAGTKETPIVNEPEATTDTVEEPGNEKTSENTILYLLDMHNFSSDPIKRILFMRLLYCTLNTISWKHSWCKFDFEMVGCKLENLS